MRRLSDLSDPQGPRTDIGSPEQKPSRRKARFSPKLKKELRSQQKTPGER